MRQLYLFRARFEPSFASRVLKNCVWTPIKRQWSERETGKCWRHSMVAGYHLVWTAYGWWLANDPRGSNSVEIRVQRLESLGARHVGRKKVQPGGKIISEFYEAAKDLLAHPLLTFDSDGIALVAESIAAVIKENDYVCHACAVMPDHVHLLLRRHRDHAESMIERFQRASRQALIDAGLRSVTHPVWGGKGWKVFLNTSEDFFRTIEYIRENPLKIGLPAEEWDFVVAYDGWLP